MIWMILLLVACVAGWFAGCAMGDAIAPAVFGPLPTAPLDDSPVAAGGVVVPFRRR